MRGSKLLINEVTISYQEGIIIFSVVYKASFIYVVSFGNKRHEDTPATIIICYNRPDEGFPYRLISKELLCSLKINFA